MKLFLLLFLMNYIRNKLHTINLQYELYPRWSVGVIEKNGNKIKCKKDEDCPFPSACCIEPFFVFDEYCCYGWNRRKLEYAYIYNTIKSKN
jgi:hypothetical protein